MTPRRSWFAALVLPVAVSGCAAGRASGSPERTSATVAAPAAVGGSHAVRVGLSEWTITVAPARVPPGRLTLTVTNAGGTEHDLVVEGRAGRWTTEDLRPGLQSRLSVRARPGETLRLWCDLPGHRAQGMHASLVVGERQTGRR